MPAQPEFAVDLAAIRDAERRIRPHVHRTPVLRSRSLDVLAGRSLLFKCECLQRGGSFKLRGAANAVLSLPSDPMPAGVVTHSSGNHAQALAIAAGLRGLPAWIVMPRTAPRVKRAAVEGYGGRIIECEPTLRAREAAAARLVAETGGALIPPFDHADVIAGQGTIALELVEQAPELEAVIVPVGGGGMISGIALALRELRPGLAVYGAEPLGADDAARSRRAGERLPQDDPRTIADGLRTSLGELTWPVVRDVVRDIFTADEPEIVAALRLVWERMKLVIEPSAAVGLAVALSERFRREAPERRVAVVLCGGNVDLDALPFGDAPRPLG
ncbi:MAG: pyridoxal-phosphate dependent enzyme [Polyangiaceae bacterium]|nr:pyridoxal-phosphate dependent enzyme [Polyangiaceae bacterium]